MLMAECLLSRYFQVQRTCHDERDESKEHATAPQYDA